MPRSCAGACGCTARSSRTRCGARCAAGCCDGARSWRPSAAATRAGSVGSRRHDGWIGCGAARPHRASVEVRGACGPRASPKAVAGTMIGANFLHLFMGNNLVGWLGGLLERMPGAQFWLLHAALVGAAAVLMLVAARLFGRLLAQTGAADP